MAKTAEVVSLPERNLGKPLPIRWSQIDRFEGQPRTIFDEDSIYDLSVSIEKERQETPVKVCTNPLKAGRFTLIHGERRWRAFGLIAARTETDPIIDAFIDVVKNAKDHFRKATLENLHREDLHPLDEAAALWRLHQDGDTIAQLAELRGKSTTYIDNYLRVHGLPQEVKNLMHPRREKHLQLTITQAIDIARGIPEKAAPLRTSVAQEAIERNLGVVDTRTLIQQHTGVSGYGVGGRLRKPSDDYKVFATFLGRARRDVERLNGKIDFDDIYDNRVNDEIDRKNDTATIRAIIKTLEELMGKINS